MPPINWEITLDRNWSENCVICEAHGVITFAMTDTKLYVPVATLSTQNNANCCKKANQVLKEQLTGININQERKPKPKTDI